MSKIKIDNLILDFDSTIVGLETLEVMVELSLADRKDSKQIMARIKDITEKAMNGTIPIEDSLRLRFSELPIAQSILDEVIIAAKETISKTLIQNIDFFRKKNLFIVSNGFCEIINPVAEKLGIPLKNVYANHLIFNEYGFCTGINSENPLSQKQGKVKIVRSLNLSGTTLVIGDGYTDFEIKKEGAAQYFFYYAEFIKRDKVYPYADKVCYNFNDVVEALS